MLSSWTRVVASTLPLWILLSVDAEAEGQVPTPSFFGTHAAETIPFDTGLLKGRLRTEQLGFGLHEVRYGTTKKPLAGSHGLLNVYRVFANDQRFGVAGWEWPSRVVKADKQAVVIAAPAEATRPFEMRARYAWRSPTTIDLEIEVLPREPLLGCDVFVASYFSPAFSQAQVNAPSQADRDRKSEFLSARQSLGDWLMFPCSVAAVPLIQDGRWQLPPHPVQWKIQPQLRRPLAVRRDSQDDLTVVLMACPHDCFAVSMPYETDPHFSVYLSFFGRDLAAGESSRARARLQVLSAPSAEDVIESYRAFEREHAHGT